MSEVALPESWRNLPRWRGAITRRIALRSWAYAIWYNEPNGLPAPTTRPGYWFDVDDAEVIESAWSLQPYLDFGRLAKLTSRTTSSEDAEALASIRKANELLAQANTSWAELCLRLLGVSIQEEKKPAENLSAEEVLENTIRFCLAEGKINSVMCEQLLQTVRLALRSQDAGFYRRVNQRIEDILRGAGSGPLGSSHGS